MALLVQKLCIKKCQNFTGSLRRRKKLLPLSRGGRGIGLRKEELFYEFSKINRVYVALVSLEQTRHCQHSLPFIRTLVIYCSASPKSMAGFIIGRYFHFYGYVKWNSTVYTVHPYTPYGCLNKKKETKSDLILKIVRIFFVVLLPVNKIFTRRS